MFKSSVKIMLRTQSTALTMTTVHLPRCPQYKTINEVSRLVGNLYCQLGIQKTTT